MSRWSMYPFVPRGSRGPREPPSAAELAQQERASLEADVAWFRQLSQWDDERDPYIHTPSFNSISRMTLNSSEDEAELEDDSDDEVVHGLTSHEISLLRTYRFQPTATNVERDRCSCCLADFEAEQMLRVLPCKHEFHTACVDKWLGENRTCPLCRVNAA